MLTLDPTENGLQFATYRDPGSDRWDIYLWQRRSNGRAFCAQVGDHGHLMFEEVLEGARMEPLLTFRGDAYRSFLRAVGTFLEDEGMTTGKSARLEALVAEKDARIQDLRQQTTFLQNQLAHPLTGPNTTSPHLPQPWDGPFGAGVLGGVGGQIFLGDQAMADGNGGGR